MVVFVGVVGASELSDRRQHPAKMFKCVNSTLRVLGKCDTHAVNVAKCRQTEAKHIQTSGRSHCPSDVAIAHPNPKP